MIGGQVIDLESEGRAVPLETLQIMDECKTGALIVAAARWDACWQRPPRSRKRPQCSTPGKLVWPSRFRMISWTLPGIPRHWESRWAATRGTRNPPMFPCWGWRKPGPWSRSSPGKPCRRSIPFRTERKRQDGLFGGIFIAAQEITGVFVHLAVDTQTEIWYAKKAAYSGF